MIKKKVLKLKHRFSTIFLLFITLSSIFTIFPKNSINLENVILDDGKNSEDEVKEPFVSTIGAAQWWNSSFEYRRLINITNTHELFTNFITSVNFNYKNLVDAGKLNQSLKDIRIVENGLLKRYYIEMDFPVKYNATIWFETDSAPGLENDTYLYYGNNNTGFASSFLMNKNPDGLIWYKFEEIIGGEVVDSMGNYNATVNGPITSADSAVGSSSLLFDGSNDYLAIKDLSFNTPNGLTEFTVSAFFKTSGSGGYSNNWAIFDFDRSEHFNFYVRGDGGLGFSSFANGWDETSNWDPNEDPYQDNNYDDFNTPTNGLNDNAWHFGSALYDGTDKVLYIDDGVEDARNDNAHSGLGIGDTTLRYGIIGDGSEATSEGTPRNNIYYNGLLDEIRFFEEALSPERIEWIAKDFTLLTQLNEEQEKRTTITVIAKDIDGKVIPGLEIFMYNLTGENYLGTTGDLGRVEFPDVKRENYIITANYSIFNGTHTFEEVVFNSSNYNVVYDFSGLGDFHTVYINTSLWSIDFEIEDWNDEPMGFGYVLVYNKTDYTDRIANLTLNKEFGTQTFRWINFSQDAAYSYEIYYDNADYEKQHTLVNRSIVDRTDYLSKKVVTIPTILVNQTNRLVKDLQNYLVQEKVYASGSNESHIGNTKIINTTITLNKMDDSLDWINVYSIDAYNNISINPIYSEIYLTETSDIIELNITELADAYGLLIDILGTNATDVCNGTIDIKYTEAYNQYIKVNMSKLVIKVYDGKGIWSSVYGNVYINVINGTSGAEIITLLTNDEGIAKGQLNSDLGFWYINYNRSSAQVYNFSLTYSGALRAFNVSSSQYTTPPGTYLTEFNYTLTINSTIEFRIQTSIADFQTAFQNKVWDTNKQWGSTFNFSIRFMNTDNGGTNWNPISDPDFVNWEITDLLGDIVYDTGAMSDVGSGYFNYTIDSGNLIGDNQYYFTVNGGKTGYQDPSPTLFLFTVEAKTTTIGVYDTNDLITSLGGNVTQYYGEQLNLTVLYRSDSINLEEAIVSYEWQFNDNPITIAESPAGEYSFVINTSIADVGTYQLRINTEKENYSSFQNYRFDVTIINRPTTLNGDESLHLISKTIWVREDYKFIFEYEDIFNAPHVKLTDLDQAYYQWYKISNGSILGVISDVIDLIEGPNSTHILDFDTASRDVGDYALFVTVQKNNYDVRTALIDLTVKKRIISWDLTATNLVQSEIRVDQGESIVIEFTLTDLAESAGEQAITGATVLLILGSEEYELEEGVDGTYTYTFTTSSIDTFFAAKVLTGEFTIKMEDYISKSIPITIVVDMTEIFPGVPMFYFLMIVGSIVAVAGSLVAYRVIQQRRIPTFVKKARSMKKNIKGKKTISDSLLYPSKEQFIVKKFGDKWAKLGLSLGEILGIKGKVKKEKLPEDQIKKVKLDKRKLEKEKLKKDKIEKKKLEKEKQEQERLEKEKLEEKELPKEKGEDK